MRLGFPKHVDLYALPPRGYRLVYKDVHGRGSVFYPVGIHWIAMGVRWLWQWTYWWRPTRLDILLRDELARGLEGITKELGKSYDRRAGLARENQELRDKVAELEVVVRKLKQLVDAWI